MSPDRRQALAKILLAVTLVDRRRPWIFTSTHTGTPSTVVLAMHTQILHPLLWFDVALLTRSDGVAVNIKLVGCVDRNAKRRYI